MSVATLKQEVEVEDEGCCVCGGSESLGTPEEHDAAAPHLPPLRMVLLHLNHAKMLPGGRLCAGCVARAHDAYTFSTTLATRTAPPLSDKIRTLRKRLHELCEKIDVFIVVGGAGGAYSEEDVIAVPKNALAAAVRSDESEQARARSFRGDSCFQCTVCPETCKSASELEAHLGTHGAGAVHACWTCGAQFDSHAAAAQHAAEHAADDDALHCVLCDTTFQSTALMREHEASCCACPACGQAATSRRELRAHAACHDTVCARCLRVFATPQERLAHALSHRQRDHFLCGYDGCILRFATRAQLVAHLRKSHGGGTPAVASAPAPVPAPSPAAPVVPCDYCDRVFGSAAAMKRHARVHRKANNADHAEIQMEWAAEGEGEEYLEVETLEDIDDQLSS